MTSLILVAKNWDKAISSGTYQDSISLVVGPMLRVTHSSVDEVNEEVKSITRSLHEVALTTLPVHRISKKQRKWYTDSTLSHLCKQKKAAWDKWQEAGCLKEGESFKQKKALRDEVRKRIKVCKANEERKRIEKIDRQFRNNHQIQDIKNHPL